MWRALPRRVKVIWIAGLLLSSTTCYFGSLPFLGLNNAHIDYIFLPQGDESFTASGWLIDCRDYGPLRDSRPYIELNRSGKSDVSVELLLPADFLRSQSSGRHTLSRTGDYQIRARIGDAFFDYPTLVFGYVILDSRLGGLSGRFDAEFINPEDEHHLFIRGRFQVTEELDRFVCY